MNLRNDFIGHEICQALARNNVPNLDALDLVVMHLTSRNGSLLAPSAHHHQVAIEHQERRVNESLRKLVMIGSLLAEQFRQMSAATDDTTQALADAWENQLMLFRANQLNGGNGCGHL